MNLSGKHILLTGASRGIGFSLAKVLAKKGAHLHLVSRSFSNDTKKSLSDLGAASVELLNADLGQISSVDGLISDLQARGVQVDVLINNAGQLTGGLLEEQSLEDIQSMLAVNVNAVIRLTRHILPQMLARKSGRIVNNASVSGKMFFPCASTYAASKAAVVAFTESMKQELRNTGVSTLLMITPGVKTEMFDEIKTLYGDHIDVSVLGSIPADDWATRVVKAIESEQDTVWPTGTSRAGVWLGHHMPGLFEKMIRSKFER